MKKAFVLCTILSLWMVGCTTKETNNTRTELPPVEATTSTEVEETKTPQTEMVYEIQDFFPVSENTTYEYIGTGDENLNYTIFNSYIQGGKVQQTYTGAHSLTDYVLDMQKDKVQMYYSESYNYFFRNDIGQEPNSNVLVLQGPLKLGASWQIDGSGTSEITNMAASVSVPYGDFEAMEVTSKYANGYEMKDYYVKGIGLVKSVQSSEGQVPLETSLKSVTKDTTLPIHMAIYYPDLDAEDESHYKTEQVSGTFQTNENGLEKITALLKTPMGDNKIQLLSPNTKINAAEVDIDENKRVVHVDLSKEYVTEMNAGSGYEAQLLQSLTDTLCHFTGTKELLLTIDGQNYESGHIALKTGETFKVTE